MTVKKLAGLFSLSLVITLAMGFTAHAESDFSTLSQMASGQTSQPQPNTTYAPAAQPQAQQQVQPQQPTTGRWQHKPRAPQGQNQATWFCERAAPPIGEIWQCSDDYQVIGGRVTPVGQPEYLYYDEMGRPISPSQVEVLRQARAAPQQSSPLEYAPTPYPYASQGGYQQRTYAPPPTYYPRYNDYPRYQNQRPWYDPQTDFCNQVPDQPGGGGQQRRNCPWPFDR